MGNNRAVIVVWSEEKFTKNELFFKKGLQKSKNCVSLPRLISQARRDG